MVNALSNPGDCLLAQCHTQRQCVAPHHHHHMPANKIYHYEIRVKGVDAPIMSSGPGRSYYQVGDRV